MKRRLCMYLSLLIFFISCNMDEPNYSVDKSGPEDETIRLYGLKNIDTSIPDISLRGVAVNKYLWENCQTIKVGFYKTHGYTDKLKENVMNSAKKWSDYASIQFIESSLEEADIRVIFDYEIVNYSLIGTQAKDVPNIPGVATPTMNFFKLSPFPQKAEADVLRMFGLALGLVYEHQGPNSTIKLDNSTVYEYYMGGYDDYSNYKTWTVQEIVDFFYKPYQSNLTNSTEFDEKSIMVWPIEDFLTTDGKGVKANTVLSEKDKILIAQLYPACDEGDITELVLKIEEGTANEIDFQKMFQTDSHVEINFGDGTNYTGSGSAIPQKLYQTEGEYVIKVKSEKISIILSNSEDMWFSPVSVKSIKFNGTTIYDSICVNSPMPGHSISYLESIEIDENNPPRFQQQSFDYAFNGTQIETIPENFFENAPEAISFVGCFGQTRLKSIPKNLFSHNTKAHDFSYCFYSCSNLTEIPENLFINNTNATSFQSCFYHCNNLKVIPDYLFANKTKAVSFANCFASCYSLEKIPTGLFKNCLGVIDFSSCFNFCDLLDNIPEDLFANSPLAENFRECFFQGYSIKSIPENLFRNNVEAINFSQCFHGCTALESIPENLFASNRKAQYFTSVFYNCGKTNHIPEKLFMNQAEALDFSYCFNQCYIQYIPEKLFENCTKVTTFHYCFGSATINTIPEDLFKNSTEVEDFSHTFIGCRSLQSIPENLFANNQKVTNFRYCFASCNAVQGNAPELWKRTNVNMSESCFRNCKYLSNYNDIPIGWR